MNQVTVDAYVGGTWSVNGAGDPVLTGGHWELGTVPVVAPATTVALPAGVTADQVQGIRFDFSRTDGANWENPATPTQTAKFTVTRRDTLRTGGPVPSDLAGSVPAPGETVAGDATNTVTATATSSDVDGDGNPLTGSDDADAVIHYRHANNAVTVTKTPDGQTKSPGSPFPYTMTFVNSGNVDIVDPVITDDFPTDASGPLIELAPDPGFAFAFTGDDEMPTDSSDVTITESGSGITFAFPAGSSIPVGDTYTITFNAVTRDGLAAGTAFTNSVDITADRLWDTCNGTAEDPAVPQCGAAATNTVISAGAVKVTKQVQAEGSDELGVDIDPLWARSAPLCASRRGRLLLPPVHSDRGARRGHHVALALRQQRQPAPGSDPGHRPTARARRPARHGTAGARQPVAPAADRAASDARERSGRHAHRVLHDRDVGVVRRPIRGERWTALPCAELDGVAGGPAASGGS
ncbi:isopeptide-forming domain-containing fimbrial protein [Microbacterium elymi]|uniref:Isopeptide-forming domain-containing fimbrial protein n=1 Tax=Microbacterium elymi TaxID=2909587 RepID=A0ABY5NIG0_9MICO|nr:isopeptide-forming domain-containing fimbrial protein [Microbacterium elymi]UUT34969.1 isopeptide-forming domain-containing fimbrial protein [Microbacterium elymi]